MNILFFLTPKSDVAFIYEDETLKEALDKMERYQYAAMPIITRQGRYVGTITEGDLLWGIKNKFDFTFKGLDRVQVTEVPRRLDNQPVLAGMCHGGFAGQGNESELCSCTGRSEKFHRHCHQKRDYQISEQTVKESRGLKA